MAKIRKDAAAAVHDEQLTRQRVELCERRISLLADVLARPFPGRLRWLLTGR
jgi:hypothetical protein